MRHTIPAQRNAEGHMVTRHTRALSIPAPHIHYPIRYNTDPESPRDFLVAIIILPAKTSHKLTTFSLLFFFLVFFFFFQCHVGAPMGEGGSEGGSRTVFFLVHHMRTPISRVLGEVGRKCPACTLPSITVSSIIDHRVAWPQIRIPNIRRTHKKMGHAADWPSSLQLLLFAPSKSIPIGCAYSVYVRRWLAGWRATHDMTIIVTPLRPL
jgi:hypothetical protein